MTYEQYKWFKLGHVGRGLRVPREQLPCVDRIARRYNQMLSMEGFPVVSDQGYYIADLQSQEDRERLQVYIAKERHRAKEILKNINQCDKKLEATE